MAGRLATALLRTQDDERLAVLASAGHAGAFDVLVSRHARTLHAVARRVAGPDAAEDVTQQALLRAWASISGGAQVRHPSGWLHRIVTTTAIDARHAMPDDTELSDDVAADFDLPDEVSSGSTCATRWHCSPRCRRSSAWRCSRRCRAGRARTWPTSSA
ncbi:MAG: RNA polymerase sigma factor [Solirubrobacteraceae bacterium]|nr:RNA polymerase sigma factor [Solirubrobacteraceae bacterium]